MKQYYMKFEFINRNLFMKESKSEIFSPNFQITEI